MEIMFEGQMQGNENAEVRGWDEFVDRLPMMEEEWFAAAPAWNERGTTNGERMCMLCSASPHVELRGRDGPRKRWE